MKKIPVIISVAALVLVSIISACNMGCIKGSGKTVTETRKIGGFSKLDINGGFKVVLKQDSSEAITITADDNVMKYIRTNISGGRLKVYVRKSICAASPVIINVGIRNLEMFRAAGSVELSNEGKLNLQNLKLDLTGANKVTLDLIASNVETKGTGSNEIYLKGQATSHTINLTGSGKLLALDFVVGRYDIKSAGSANFEVNALTSININTAGAASVKYKGNASIEQKNAGALDVSKVD